MSFISRKLHFRADDYVCAGQKKPLLPQQQKQQEARFVFLCFCVLRAGVCRGEKSGMIVKFVQISFPYHHRLSPLRLRPSPPLLLPCRWADGLWGLAGRSRGYPLVSSGSDTLGDTIPASGRYDTT